MSDEETGRGPCLPEGGLFAEVGRTVSPAVLDLARREEAVDIDLVEETQRRNAGRRPEGKSDDRVEVC